MCTLHDFLSSKVRFIHTSTVTRSLSWYGKNYAYASRTSCYLSKLQCINDSPNTPYISILGDFNSDIQATSIFGAELIEFRDNNNLCFLDKELLPPDSFTYISQAHGTTSW